MIYEKLITLTAQKIGVPFALLMAICSHEGGGKNVLTPNDKGTPSYGVCQVKSDTAIMFGYTGSEQELMIPKNNIRVAAKYLKYQLDRYDNDWCKATAAYNAGTYYESKKLPGKPKNYGYIQLVNGYLDEELTCGN